MLDSSSWEKLLDGLVRATKKERLEWEETSIRTDPQMRSLDLFNQPQTFRGTNGNIRYELSSNAGRAPFELTVREMRPRVKTIGTIRSSTEIENPITYSVNQLLEVLFNIVAMSVEPGDQIVSRLLGELGEG